MTTKRIWISFFVFFYSAFYSNYGFAAGFNWAPLSTMAVQERGRIKPFDTFAGESVQFITGGRKWNGQASEETVFSWLANYEQGWSKNEFVLVDHKPLKEAVGLDPDRKFFAPSELMENAALGKMTQEAYQKQGTGEAPSAIEKKAMEVSNRLGLLRAIVGGAAWTMLPNPEGPESSWFSLSSLMGDQENPVPPYPPAQLEKLSSDLRDLVTSYVEGRTEEWNKTMEEFATFVRNDLAPNSYPSIQSLEREKHYNHFRPFRWAWVAYTIAFLLLLTFIFSKNKVLGILSGVSVATAFGLHIYGFVLRVLISGRPPVTNMYESIIWVTFGCVFFSLLIWIFYKQAVIPTAACVFAIVGLVLADNLPSILDPAINPLEPVLRSNFWLTIHVLTITLSYAAFALSLCLGNVVLGNHLFTPTRTDRIQTYSLYMYRAMQIGVLLLAAGTILGGVWADYSWGRFWGWDPKEVWALVALLLYLAVLHGRFSGWLRGFGFVTATVMSFLGVLMAWYGVNFVLGAGLHSYGFGTGGTGYVIAYILAQLGFVLAAYLHHRKAGGDTAIFPKGNR